MCPHASEVVKELQDAGFEAFIVGGSVRDLILGKAPKDFDVATSATPEEVQDVFPRCRLIGRRFRLAHVRKSGALIEVATFRGASTADTDDRDHAHANGRILRDNVYGEIHDDVWRRDFTCNALYYNIADFSIIDYTGGVEDIQKGELRLLGDPEQRYREDPVRMLRAVRFSAKLGFRITQETLSPVAELADLLGIGRVAARTGHGQVAFAGQSRDAARQHVAIGGGTRNGVFITCSAIPKNFWNRGKRKWN